MPGFIVRLAITVLGLWIASEVVPGMAISGFGTFVLAALLLGIVNALVRPLAILFTLPFTIVTLGLFLLVINASMLGLVAWLLKGFSLSGFGAAFFGSIIVSLTGWVSSQYIGPRGSVEVMVIQRGGGPSEG